MTVMELLQSLGVFGIAVAALSWLSRAAIGQFLSRDLERFRSDLEKEAVAYKIRYERLHTERVQVTKEVYKRIACSHESLRLIINPWQPAGEPAAGEVQEAMECYRDLIRYYHQNRIFFEESVAKDIDSLLSEFHEIWRMYQGSRMATKDGEYKEARKELDVAWERMSQEVPSVTRKLEAGFRNSLGIAN